MKTLLLLTIISCAALINSASAQPDDSQWRQMTDPHSLMRIGRDSCLHGDYLSAARIYCRAFAVGSRAEHAVLNHFATYVADADSADKAGALKIFRDCALADSSSDTALIRGWLANQYSRAGFFDMEIAVLVEFDLPDASSGRRLAEAARGHFSNRRYRHAASAAVAAHGRVEESDTRGNTAFLAYQSYLQLGIRDSALIWLKASGTDNRDARVQAVALHQETGLLAEASALIDSLPASLSKDTLRVRQFIFSGEPGAALNELLTSKSASWTMNRRDWMLWRGRGMVFGGQRVHEAAAVFDSIRFQAHWHGSAEILRYRYWIQKLDGDYGALSLWGKLEHFMYVGDLTAAMALFKSGSAGGEAGETMAVRLAREFAKAGRHAEGLEALEVVGDNVPEGDIPKSNIPKGNIPKSNISDLGGIDITILNGGGVKGRGPEYLYFKAEMLAEIGRGDEARAVVNRILTEFPGDIFAQKARVLLMRI